MTTIVAVVSDLHANSTVAICPPRVTLDDGGTYESSKAQKWLWGNWLDYWGRVKKFRKRGYKLIVVVNGDAVDGDHHDTPQIISRNMNDQHRIALAVLRPMLDLKPTSVFFTRGTEIHVGKNAQWEEYIADDIGAVPEPGTGASSWWWLPLDVEGVRFDIAHHGKVGTLPWSKVNIVNRFAYERIIWYTQVGRPLPHYVIRSHRHTPVDTHDNAPIRVFQTPSWQLSTAFGQRLGAGALLPVGGLIFGCDKGKGEVLDKPRYEPEPQPYWVAV